MGCKPSKSKGPADPVDEPARTHATAGALEATSAPTAGAVTIEGDNLDVMLPSFDLDALEEQDAAARLAAEAENAKASQLSASAPEAAPSAASVEVEPENAVAPAAADESTTQTQAPLAPAPAEAPAEASAETPAVTPAINAGEEAARALREANESLARMTEREEEARRGWEAASDDARQLRATLVAERECYAAELAHLARVLKVRPHADSPSCAITMESSRAADLACCRRLRPPKLLTAALAPHLASSRRRTRSKTHRSPRPTCARWSRAAPSEARS